MGGPKRIPLDLQPEDPENYPSLVRYLEAQGKVRHIPQIHVLKARNMFLQGRNIDEICRTIKVEKAIVERWSLIFEWEEERDRRLFESFRRVSGLGDRMSKSLGERHDRIAGSLEQCAERILTQHQNGDLDLSVKDLATIASTIKTTQEIRRTARGQAADKKEVSVHVIPASLDRLATAFVDSQDRPKLTYAKTKAISVQEGKDAVGTDVEFEVK